MATLKISDLSVGDWVGVRCGTKINAFKVEEIRFNNIIHKYVALLNNKAYGLPTTELHPIPITAEILEKNGWSTDGLYAILRIDEHLHLEYYYHEHRLRKYYCGVDEWQNHAKVNDITFAAHCYSVHQLQHALRLAGVDKEINL